MPLPTWFVLLPLICACDPMLLEPPLRRLPDGGTAELTLSSGACCDVSEYVRFSWTTAPSGPFPMLFRDTLSEYQTARLDNPTLPNTLLERQIEVASEWLDGVRWFAPVEPLSPGTYTLVRSEAETTVVTARAVDGPSWRRAWPVDNEPTRLAVYCARGTQRGVHWELRGEWQARVIPGRNDCVGIAVEPGTEPRLSPSELFGTPAQATVLTGQTRRERPALPGDTLAPDLECPEGEIPFVTACARVLDDRIRLRTSSDSFWLVSGAVAFSGPSSARSTTVVAGFEPGSVARLEITLFRRSGDELFARVDVRMGEPRPHVVITEVLANPAGTEPDQEWVELYNDGEIGVELADWTLADGGGITTLPPHWLQPGKHVLVVSDEFLHDSPWDVAPAQETALLRVAELGRSGLSNAGEPLQLALPDGTVVSRFPARKAPSGQSIARRTPHTDDEDPGGFLPHGLPGASPGAPNWFDEP